MAKSPNSDLRRAILDTARDLLIQDGYKNLSMRKIAHEIKCSPGTIYLYFKNKDAIFYALIDEGLAQLCNEFETLQSSQPNPLKRLKALCKSYIQFGLENSEYYEIMFSAHPMVTERYPKEQYRKARRILELTAATLTACTEEGTLDIGDPFMDATILWASLHGIVSLTAAHRVDARLSQDLLIDKSIDHAINGFDRYEREL